MIDPKIQSLIEECTAHPESFISQCEHLARDIQEKNPFDAAMDGKRIEILVEIVKKYLEINK